MHLPELSLQIAYGRIGWAIVAATLAAALLGAVLRTSAPPSRRLLACLLGGSLAAMLLPGELSPAYWLGLAFQYPSGVLVGCCALRLAERWHGIRRSRAMPHALAGVLAVTGTLLYLDTVGWLARGFYYAGFGPVLMPALAVLAAAACALAILRGHARGPASALLFAVALFSLLRLPSGNLWDALLDPLLWGWAMSALVMAALRRTGRRASDRIGAVEPEAGREPVPAPSLRPLAAEHFLNVKEQVGGK